MRTFVLPLIALLLTGTARAQISAGDVPAGTSVVNVGIDLTLSTPFTTDTETFDLDCDSVADIIAELIRGEPAIDAPNVARLDLLDPDLELCVDLAPSFNRPQYYAFGQALDCTGGFDWQSDTVNVLGDIGTFTAIGPAVIDSMYVAYRSGTQVGWILLSFDLNGGLLPVRLQIHQVLQLCSPTAITDPAAPPSLALFPNPNNGQVIHVESPDALRSIDLLDPAGKVLVRYDGTVRTIVAPEVAGTYLVRVSHADGRRSITRLVRY